MSMRYYISTEEASFFLNNRMGYANSIPSSGTYKVGDFIISSTQKDGIFGWVCTVSGTPGEWEVIGSGMGNGSGTNAPVVGYINAVSFSDTRSSIEIGIDEYVKGKDFLEVHYNGLMLAEGVHYNVSENGKSINAIDGTWNANANDTQQMIFRVIKSESIKVKELKNTINIDSACHEVEMGIAGYIPGKDLVEVHLNGVLLVQGLDYEIVEGKISKIDKSEAWNPYNVSGQKMFVRIFRNIANVIEPDNDSVTMEKLSPDVRSNITAIDGLVSSMNIQNSTISGLNDRVTAIENAGDTDISGKQDKTDNGLATTDKTIVGAINELFQNANNGKQLIANAIGEPLTAEDTFSAMSTGINGLLSTFKTNMMSNGITVEGTDKFKQLIDKIATMVEEGSGKGIQFAEGIYRDFTEYLTTSGTTVEVPYELNFTPTLLFVKFNRINTAAGTTITNVVISNKGGNGQFYMNYGLLFGLNNITANSFSMTWSYGNNSNVSFEGVTWYAIGVGEEDTTLRDSLASILQDEGVSVTPEDNMASLITKVDNEFDRKNTELENNKGLDIICATRLPSKVVNNQLCLITESFGKVYIADKLSTSSLSEGDVYISTATTGHYVTTHITTSKSDIILNLSRIVQIKNGTEEKIDGYVGINGQWEPTDVLEFYLFKQGTGLHSSVGGFDITDHKGTYSVNNSSISLTAYKEFGRFMIQSKNKIDLTGYSKLEVKSSSSGYGEFTLLVGNGLLNLSENENTPAVLNISNINGLQHIIITKGANYQNQTGEIYYIKLIK